MFLTYGGTPTYTENTGLGSLSISTGDTLQTSEIRGQELLNLYPALFTAVTTVDILQADGSVTNAKLANLAQGSIKVGGASDLVTDVDASIDGQMLIGDGTDLNSVAISGDIAIINDGTVTIQEGAVDVAMMEGLADAEIIVGVDGTAANNTKVVMAGDLTMLNDGTTAIGADKVLSSMISPIIKKVSTTVIATADVLTLFGTPVELVAAPAAGSYIVVDRITASIDYVSAAYATNTTLEFSYGTATTKCTADIASLLAVTADTVQSVGGIEAELSLALNDNIEVNVATGNPTAGDSDLTITTEYRILSI